MGCTNPNVPPYLYYDAKRRTYPCWRFSFWHLIYRTGHRSNANPIDALTMRTGYSVCWSKLIQHDDVLKTVLATNPKLGDSVYFGAVNQFKKLAVEIECKEGEFKGKHIVKTKLFHKPIECNYSHSEVLLQHDYFHNNKKQSKILQYEDWQNSLFEKGKPKQFFKELKAGYRAKVLTILNTELTRSTLPFYVRFHPKILMIQILIFIKLR